MTPHRPHQLLCHQLAWDSPTLLRDRRDPCHHRKTTDTEFHGVRDGAAILNHLLPLFIDLMMDNSNADWTTPLYPVIEE